ncbi:MAG: hypothetical protein AAGH46_13160, partial [Bacteroidota bacterium]
RKDRAYLAQIFSSIKKELVESQKDIERVIPKQTALLDSLNRYLNDETKSLYDIILSADGIHGPSIKTNSWNAIANTKIELVEYQKLSELAEVAERKEAVGNRLEKLTEFIFQNFENTSQQKKEIARFMTYDIIAAEKRFNTYISEILAKEK